VRTINNFANQSCGMDTTRDGALHVQVLDGGFFHITEKRTRITVMAINVHINRMTIAVEGTIIGGIFANSYTTGSGEVGLQTGIDPILTLGICHCLLKRIPLGIIMYGEKGLSCCLFYA